MPGASSVTMVNPEASSALANTAVPLMRTGTPLDKLVKFIEHFVPASLRQSDTDKFRAMTIVGYAFLNLLAMFVCLPVLLVLRMDLLHNIVGFGMLLLISLSSLWTLKVLKRTESTILAGNTSMLCMFVLIFFACYITGGISGSPLNTMLTVVPIFALLLAGFYSGVFWSLLVIFLQSFGVYAEQHAVNEAFQMLNEMVFQQFAILSPPIMLVIVALCAVALEYTNSELTGQLHRERSRFYHKAAHDALTGLANRHTLNHCLGIAVSTARLNKSKLSTLLYMDLDGFKQVNDTLGHQAGDEVLKIVAKRLLSVTRSSDYVARFGGDEFAVVLTGAACREDLIPLLQKIIAIIAEPMIIQGREVSVRTSIGVSVCPEDTEDENQMARQADMALYEAKKTKNTFCFYRDIPRNAAS